MTHQPSNKMLTILLFIIIKGIMQYFFSKRGGFISVHTDLSVNLPDTYIVFRDENKLF